MNRLPSQTRMRLIDLLVFAGRSGLGADNVLGDEEGAEIGAAEMGLGCEDTGDGRGG